MIIDKPLYHGTDLNIFEIDSKVDISIYKNASINLIKFLYPLYNDKYIFKNSCPENEQNENEFRNNKLICLGDYFNSVNDSFIAASTYNSPLYEYNDFYLTGSYDKAKNYAKRSRYFGEIGYISYHLYLGAKLLKYDKLYDKKNIQEFLDILEPFWQNNPKPVVFEFTNIDSKFLYTQKNAPLMFDMFQIIDKLDFRYKKIPDFNSAKKHLI